MPRPYNLALRGHHHRPGARTRHRGATGAGSAPGEVGYPGVAAYSLGILALFLAMGAFIRWWGNARGQELAIVPPV